MYDPLALGDHELQKKFNFLNIYIYIYFFFLVKIQNHKKFDGETIMALLSLSITLQVTLRESLKYIKR